MPPNTAEAHSAARVVTRAKSPANVTFLRWDHAPVGQYYNLTRITLQPIMDNINTLISQYTTLSTEQIEQLYNAVIIALKHSADNSIPKRTKNFYKFWWNQELTELKEKAITSSKIWKNSKKPKHGPIYLKYKQDKMHYKRAVREEQMQEKRVCTNDLHEALLQKSLTDFWKCWNSKFLPKSNYISQIDGLTDETDIANHFAEYFEGVCSPLNEARNKDLIKQYLTARSNYSGSLLTE